MQEVPDDVQAIVFDGVVNHRSDFAKELVDAAKNGASLTDIKNMRNEEYMRLASLDPNNVLIFNSNESPQPTSTLCLPQLLWVCGRGCFTRISGRGGVEVRWLRR